jgi:HD-like signal output (HDOD) protein
MKTLLPGYTLTCNGAEELELITRSAESLPAIPVIAARVLAMVRDDEVRIEDLTRTVLADPAMAAKVVKMANSPFYGWRRNIRTIPEAITLLGFNTLKGLVLAASLSQVYQPFGPTEKMLWEHASAVAMAARFLAASTRRALMEEAFLVGLLHDVGKQVLNVFAPRKYEQVASLMIYQGLSASVAERLIFTFAHDEVGGRIVEQWNFPEELVFPVRYHHRFTELVGTDEIFTVVTEESLPVLLTALVGLADQFCLKLGIGCHGPQTLDIKASRQAYYLGIAPENVLPLLETFQKLYTEEWVDLIAEM